MKKIREDLVNSLYQYDLLKRIEEENEVLKDIILNLDEIDDIINDNLYNYHLSRLSFLDRAIIRVATYELRFTETPAAIIIDEAVNITKKYTDLDDEKQHKFNNKVLDNINKSLRGWYFAKTNNDSITTKLHHKKLTWRPKYVTRLQT